MLGLPRSYHNKSWVPPELLAMLPTPDEDFRTVVHELEHWKAEARAKDRRIMALERRLSVCDTPRPRPLPRSA